MRKNRYAISDELWERIQPHLPPRENTHPRGGGRKPKDDRLVFDAILFVLRFGCQWNALNATGLCPSSTVHDRFRKWTSAGVFQRLWDAGLLEQDSATKGIDWAWVLAEGNESRTTAPRRRLRGGTAHVWRENRAETEIAR